MDAETRVEPNPAGGWDVVPQSGDRTHHLRKRDAQIHGRVVTREAGGGQVTIVARSGLVAETESVTRNRAERHNGAGH